MAGISTENTLKRAITAAPAFARGIIVNWEWTAKQIESLLVLAQFLLYGGAKGGGKTVFLCRWAVLQCLLFIGNKVFLGRKRSVDFTKTTLETFKRYIDPRLYRIYEQKKMIVLPWCRGQIDYGGLDDPEVVDKFNSAEYGAVGIDQSEEITQDQLGSLVGTLRHKLPDGSEPSYEVRLTANPAECFLKYLFIEHPKMGNPQTGKGTHRFIKALHSDNPFLPTDYIPNLIEALKHRPQLLKAYIEGIWDNLAAADILIQPSWIDDCKTLNVLGHATRRALFCDVARHGDDETVTYALEQCNISRVIHEKIEGFTDNLIDLGFELVQTRRRLDAKLIGIDAVQLGAGVYDYARKMKDDEGKLEPVFGFVGGSTDIPDLYKNKYTNLNSLAWHLAADMIRERKVLIPDDPVLCGQLLWQKTRMISEIRQGVLTKKELKEAHSGDSPDRAEAFVRGLYMLRISQPLPDIRPIDNKTEFWERVKKDVREIQSGEREEADEEVL